MELGRTHDVYVGVDVFGRGCHGGGGFNTVEVQVFDMLLSLCIHYGPICTEILLYDDGSSSGSSSSTLLNILLVIDRITVTYTV